MNKVLWKITNRKVIKILIILLMIGLSLSVYGAMNSKKYSKGESSYSESSTQVVSINHYNNHHIAESIGIVLVVLSIIIFQLHSVRKKIFFRKVDEISRRFLETDNKYLIRINENYVEYDSLDLYMKINWIRFLNYKCYENFIFIKFENNSSTITIDKRLISKNDLDILFALFKSNNIQKIK